MTESQSATRDTEARSVQRTEASTRGSCEVITSARRGVRCYHAELLLLAARLPGAGEADIVAAEVTSLVLATHAVLHPVTQPGTEVTRHVENVQRFRPGAVPAQAHGAAHEAAGGRGAEAAIHRPRPGLRPQLTRALLAAAQWRLEAGDTAVS